MAAHHTAKTEIRDRFYGLVVCEREPAHGQGRKRRGYRAALSR